MDSPPARHHTSLRFPEKPPTMEFFRITRDIPFMRHALVFNMISLVTFLIAVIFLATAACTWASTSPAAR